MKLQIHSRGLYSTFVFIPDHDLLFDAGEGVSMHIGPSITSVRRIFLTHAHTDHISGLVTLLNLRSRSKGVDPVHIYYPENTHRIYALRAFIGEMSGVRWIPIAPGAEIEIGKLLFVRAFATAHIPGSANHGSLGYAMIERRSRMKAEYRNLKQAEISAMAIEAKSRGEKLNLSEEFEKTLLVYTGDTGPLPDSTLQSLNKPDVLIHDATYLLPEDSENDRHSTVAVAEQAAAKSGAYQLIGLHLSVRYEKDWEKFVANVNPNTLLIPPNRRLHTIDTKQFHIAAATTALSLYRYARTSV